MRNAVVHLGAFHSLKEIWASGCKRKRRNVELNMNSMQCRDLSDHSRASSGNGGGCPASLKRVGAGRVRHGWPCKRGEACRDEADRPVRNVEPCG